MKNVIGLLAADLSSPAIVPTLATGSSRDLSRVTKGRRTPFALLLAVLIAGAGLPSAPAQSLQLGNVGRVPAQVQAGSQPMTQVGWNSSQYEHCSPEYKWYDWDYKQEKCHECTSDYWWNNECNDCHQEYWYNGTCHRCLKGEHWDGRSCFRCDDGYWQDGSCHNDPHSYASAQGLVPSLPL